MSFRKTCHTHSDYVGYCRHERHDIRSSDGIPGLRSNGPNGVANKKVQMQIDKCLREIAEIDSILSMPRGSSSKVREAEQRLKTARQDLTQQLADLRKREYYSPKLPAKKSSSSRSSSMQRNLSPAATTSSEKSSSPADDSHRSRSSTPSPFTPPRTIVRLGNMPLEQFKALDVEAAMSLPLDLRPESLSVVPDSQDQSPLSSGLPIFVVEDNTVSESEVEIVSPTPVQELVVEEDVNPLEQYLRPLSPADSLAVSEDSLEEVEPVDLPPVEDPLERAALVDQYVETADRVCQVYALCMTRIALQAGGLAVVDPAQPLAEEFDSVNRAVAARVKEGRDALEEHVLPRSASNFKHQKQRYERERRDHARFVQTVLDNLPETPANAKQREYLTKYLDTLSKPLPEDPAAPAGLVRSFFQFEAQTLEHSADETLLLSQKAQAMSSDALKEAIAEQEAFLQSLDETVITLNMEDPHVKAAVAFRQKIGVTPQGYIDQYSRLLRGSSSQAKSDVALQEYFDAIDQAAGNYQAKREKLESRKSELCRLIEKDVLPHTSDRRAVEEAMNAFHPQSKAVF